MNVTLCIGGYHLRLHEHEDRACLTWPLTPFDAFEAPIDAPPDIHLTVRVVSRLPELPKGGLLFDSCHGLWKLYEAGDGYLMDCPDPKTLVLRSRTVLDADFSRGEVWICGLPTGRPRQLGWRPLYVFNPIAEVCLLTRLARDGGLLLHAAGALTEQGGWVFTGPSGAGKSTLSDFFAARGASVLSDERVIIRRVAGQLTVFGTPWPGAGRLAQNRHGALTALYCIAHGHAAHALRRMTSREVSTFALPQCFLPHWDRTAMTHTLSFLVELADHVDCAGLAFVKNPDVVEYLATQCANGAVGRS